MGLNKANEVLECVVDMLKVDMFKEGKRIDIDWPDLDNEVKNMPLRDRRSHPKNVSYHKELSATQRVDVPRAVKQVMTWKRDMSSVDSYHTVIRMMGRGAKRDFVFSVYDLDPDGPKRSSKYRASVYMRRVPDRTMIIGEFRSVRAAKDAARRWLMDQAATFQARSLERISLSYKKLGEGMEESKKKDWTVREVKRSGRGDVLLVGTNNLNGEPFYWHVQLKHMDADRFDFSKAKFDKSLNKIIVDKIKGIVG